jgi:hypothetical protein
MVVILVVWPGVVNGHISTAKCSETVLNPLPRLKDSDFRDRQVPFLGKYWVIFAQK